MKLETRWWTFGNSEKRLLRKDPAEPTADSLFGEQIIEDQPELSASFYTEWNPAAQAAPHPYQPFSLNDFQPPSSLELPADPIGPITMTSYMNPVPHNSTHVKEYGLNKPMPFSGDQMKVKAFPQESLVYIDMNEDVYMTDKLKIGFVLLYMNEQEAKDWRELYISKIQQQESWCTQHLALS